MPILVPHFGLAKQLGEKQIQSSATTVKALFAELQSRLSAEDFKKAMASSILVNGRNITYTGGMDTPLASDDQVWMVLFSAGG